MTILGAKIDDCQSFAQGLSPTVCGFVAATSPLAILEVHERLLLCWSLFGWTDQCYVAAHFRSGDTGLFRGYEEILEPREA